MTEADHRDGQGDPNPNLVLASFLKRWDKRLALRSGQVKMGKADILAGLKTIVGLTNYEADNLYSFIMFHDLVGERADKGKYLHPNFSNDQSRRAIALGTSFLKFRPHGVIHDKVWADVIPDTIAALTELGYPQEFVEGIRYPEFLRKK